MAPRMNQPFTRVLARLPGSHDLCMQVPNGNLRSDLSTSRRKLPNGHVEIDCFHTCYLLQAIMSGYVGLRVHIAPRTPGTHPHDMNKYIS